MRLSGGRAWWAHFEFTRINIAPTILPKKIEGLRQLRAVMFTLAISYSKLLSCELSLAVAAGSSGTSVCMRLLCALSS